MSVTKKLRCSEPDLTIVVGKGDDQQTHLYHSILMASQSNFIDTMLSTPMCEQKTMKITFPDIEPTIWEEMIKFLDVANCHGMELENVQRVLPFYDKYAFEQGTSFCSSVLSQFVERNWDVAILPKIVEVMVLSTTYGLEACGDRVVNRLGRALVTGTSLLQFSRQDLVNLIALLQEYEKLWDFVMDLLGGSESTSTDALDNPMFVDLLSQRIQLHFVKETIGREVQHVVVKGASTYFDRTYTLVGRGRFEGRRRNERCIASIRKSSIKKCWRLCIQDVDERDRRRRKSVFIAPSTGPENFPPMAGWVDCAVGEPSTMRVEYIFKQACDAQNFIFTNSS